MKRIAYFVALGLGIVFWLVALLAGTLTALLAVWGGRAWPDAPRSNCWIFALQRYGTRDGCLIVRPAIGVRAFGWMQIPHVAWAASVPPDIEAEAYEPRPEDRRRAVLFPWFVFWYRGRVVNKS